jgi:putative ABC transport system permease protein
VPLSRDALRTESAVTLPRLLDELGQDLRAALRTSARSPGLTVLACLTLALGIGASTALFSVGYGVLLRPLPYRDADRLAVVTAEQDYEGASGPSRTRFPTAAVELWPARGRTFDRVSFHSEELEALSGAETSELVDAAVVSGPFFETIAGELALGRGLVPSDDLQPVAVISERLWRRVYAGAPDVLGRTVMLTGRAHAIVGVAASSFQVPTPRTDLWIPAGYFRGRAPGCCSFTPILRLTPGSPATDATREIAVIAERLAAALPRWLGGIRVRVVGLRDVIVGDTRPALLVLGAAVGLLLVLACANVANLLLARAAARAHETSLRRALGAPRRRLVFHALAESLVLAASGGLAGVALAAIAVRALKAASFAPLPRLDAVEVDATTLLFALAAAAASTAAIALFPALQSGEISPSLNARHRGIASSRAGRLALRALTVAQLAISIVLLVGAALLGRSLAALMRVDLGIAPEQVATASLNLSMGRRLTDQQQIDLVDRVVERIASLPEVGAAGAGTARPPDASRMRLTLNRRDDPNARASYQASAVPATPGYFRALGVRLERGRVFTGADTIQAPPVVMMSAGTARRLFGDQDPVGRTIGLPVLRDGKAARETMTVVGITADVKYGGLDRAADDVVYRPFAQQAWRSVFLVARTSGDPAALASRLRREIAAVDRAITVADVTTLEAVLSDATARPRFRALVLGAFAGLAILIATVGLYGVVAYTVSQRAAEIGVRMALGADGRRIRRMVLREGMVLALAGGALGLVGAHALTRLLATLLFGIAPTDPVSYALAAAGVIAAGLVASCVPAARAARADPLVVLRAE